MALDKYMIKLPQNLSRSTLDKFEFEFQDIYDCEKGGTYTVKNICLNVACEKR